MIYCGLKLEHLKVQAAASLAFHFLLHQELTLREAWALRFVSLSPSLIELGKRCNKYDQA